jgi:tetratricopeptide (TPR) repeat protein
MPSIPQSEFPVPRSWEEFEDIVADVYRRKWNDPHVRRYGRSGQAQQGVDIYGQPEHLEGTGGIQCKRYSRGTLDRATVEREIAKAEDFTPPLAEYVIVTTDSRDAELQRAELEINQERRAAGKFLVRIVFWDDLCTWLVDLDNRDILLKHYGDWLSAIEPIVRYGYQIPDPPPLFRGREDEIDELTESAGEIGVAVSGMPGVGKTALALKLAQLLASSHPDGQILIELDGTTPLPLSPGEAMAHVIHAFHPKLDLPESDSELAALFRSVLRGKRVLLLLDNASDAEQVGPLIPPSPCRLLVTSRTRFYIPGVHSLALTALNPEDACALLEDIAPRIRDCAEEMAELCGYLPMALRIAASALAERVDLPAADYVRRLRDKQVRLKLVEAQLSLSYDLLTEEMQRLWRLLAVFPGTFDGEAASAVWDLETDYAQDRLSDLLRYSMLEWNPMTERYRLHDLAQIFADSRLSEDERGATRRRYVKYYADVIGRAGELYRRGGDSLLEGLALYDLERHNLKAAQAWAVKHADVNDAAKRLCMVYLDSGGHLLILRERADERVAWAQAAIHAAIQLGHREALGVFKGHLGLAYLDLGQPQQALLAFGQALAISVETKDRPGEGIQLSNFGGAFIYLGKLKRAIASLERAATILQEVGPRSAEVSALGNLGVAHDKLGHYEQAMGYYKQALEIARETGNLNSKAQQLANLAQLYSAVRKPKEALSYLEEALSNARELGNRRMEGICVGNMGGHYCDFGQPRKAIGYLQQGLDIARELIDARTEANWLRDLGKAHLMLGQVNQAASYYKQARCYHQEVGDRRGECMDWLGLGLVYLVKEQPEQAIKCLNESLTISTEVEDRQSQGQSLGSLGNAYHAQGQPKRAIEYVDRALAVAREIGDRQGESRLLANLGGIRCDLEERDRGIECFLEALTIAQDIGDSYSEALISWNLGEVLRETDPQRAVELMGMCVDYLDAIGHRDAETNREIVNELEEQLQARYKQEEQKDDE